MDFGSIPAGMQHTRYYVGTGIRTDKSLIVVSTFNSSNDAPKAILEFLVFSWDDPSIISFPYIERFGFVEENLEDLIDAGLSGPIREYILDKQSMNDYSRRLNNEQLSIEQVERNIINVIAFPHGLSLLEIIILATECIELREELKTLRDFILLVNSSPG